MLPGTTVPIQTFGICRQPQSNCHPPIAHMPMIGYLAHSSSGLDSFLEHPPSRQLAPSFNCASRFRSLQTMATTVGPQRISPSSMPLATLQSSIRGASGVGTRSHLAPVRGRHRCCMPPGRVPLNSLNRLPCSEMAMQVMLTPHHSRRGYSLAKNPSLMSSVLASEFRCENQCPAQIPDPDLNGWRSSNSCSLLRQALPDVVLPSASVACVLSFSCPSPFDRMALLWAADAESLFSNAEPQEPLVEIQARRMADV